MRLVLKLDAPWMEVAPDDGEALVFRRDDVGARLHTTPLYDRFAPPPRSTAPDEVGVEVVAETDARSALGWPVRVIERVVRSTGATRRELDVRYELFELGGAAIVSGPDGAIARHRDELLAAVLAGRPDWTGDVACVAELLPGAS